jgi:hypothetical protein
MKKIILLSLFLVFDNRILRADISLPNTIYIPDKKLIFNEKHFSGPMGMGLIKSYEYKKNKFCVYNKIDGPRTIMLTNVKSSCPKKLDD